MYDILLSLIAWGAISGISVFFIVSRQKSTLEQEKLKEIEFIKNWLEKRGNLIEEEKNELLQSRQKIEKMEEKILEKEDKLEKKLEEIELKSQDIIKKNESIDKQKEEITLVREELRTKLSDIAKLTKEEAKELIMKQTEEIYEKDVIDIIEKKKKEIKLKEKEVAREILIKAVQQYSWEVISETTQTTLHLDNDDIKWKLIWKEWRNIIAFERETWVSLIIDDTPDTVFISSFDLFRRYIAKKSLEQLIEDKRIQPARIEEIVSLNKADAEKLIFEFGEKTVNEMWISGLPTELLSLIWKLRFRTSFWQNILTHSKEVAYIAEALAKELWADPALALKWGLLHDIGKALDHDIEWTHPEIWGKIARKYGLNDKLINIIEGHHDWVAHTCIETQIIQIADAISAVRPGARRASVEQYIKRIQEMENLAASFPWVTKAYALSAWREVRMFVDCQAITDLQAEKMAREVALSIENNLSYPGEVKVTLIREKRITEYAR
ncbi:MAG: RNA binding metal dependent phosphohydrolase [uncultured bacterium (gcode 4)]|uniref:Ribonuclease Y n=1 Tax=uncultured bacterium (gcode 4) TaxID=1234023 RepID=K2H036_9BACT|nr:MAG: RNA binding metal dependent phosphohydrolase [uncultured bacterium (gcode 4)]